MEDIMSARKYLAQAYRLDQRISSGIEQLSMLKDMSTHITQNLNDICVQTSHDNTRMENTVIKIIEQEKEIDAEIDALVDLKAEIRHVIGSVDDIDRRLILEKRYLLFEKWEEIALEMNMSVQHVYRLHNEAMVLVDEIFKDESK